MDNIPIDKQEGPRDLNPLVNEGVKETGFSELANKILDQQKVPKAVEESLDSNAKVLRQQLEMMPYTAPISKSESKVLYKIKRAFRSIAIFLGVSYRKEKIEVARSVLNMIAPDIESPRGSNKHAVRGIIAFYENELKDLKANNADEKEISKIRQSIEMYKLYQKFDSKLSQIKSKGDARSAHSSIGKMVSKKMETMEQGDQFIAPLYFYDAKGSHEGLIQVRKSGEGDYTIRILAPDSGISMDKQGSYLKEKSLPFVQFNNVSEKGVPDTLSEISSLYMIWKDGVDTEEKAEIKAEKKAGQTSEGKGLLAFAKQAMQGMKDVLKELDTQSEVEFDIVGFVEQRSGGDKASLDDLQGELGVDNLAGQFVSVERASNIRKRMLHSLKGGSSEEYDKVNIKLQYQSFRALCEAHPSLLKDVNIKDEIDLTAKYLLTKFEKFGIDENGSEISFLEGVLSEKPKDVKSSKLKLGKLKAKKISQKLSLSTEVIDLDNGYSSTRVEVKRPPSVDISALKVSLEGVLSVGEVSLENLKGVQMALSGILSECKDLYNSGDFEALEELVFQTIKTLPDLPEDISDLSGLENCFWGQFRDYAVMEESEPSTTFFNMMGKYLLETQRDLHGFIKTPHYVVAFAKIYAITDCMQDPKIMEKNCFYPFTSYSNFLKELPTTDISNTMQSLNVCKYFREREYGMTMRAIYGGGKVTSYEFPIVYEDRFAEQLVTDERDKLDDSFNSLITIMKHLQGRDDVTDEEILNASYGITGEPHFDSLRSLAQLTAFAFDPLSFVEKKESFMEKLKGGEGDKSHHLSSSQVSVLDILGGRENLQEEGGDRPFFSFPSQTTGSFNNCKNLILRPQVGIGAHSDGYSRKIIDEDPTTYSKVMDDIKIANVTDGSHNILINGVRVNKLENDYHNQYIDRSMYADMANTHINISEGFYHKSMTKAVDMEKCLPLTIANPSYINEPDFFQFALDSLNTVKSIEGFRRLNSYPAEGHRDLMRLLSLQLQTRKDISDDIGVVFFSQLLFSLALVDTEGMEKLGEEEGLDYTLEGLFESFASHVPKCSDHPSLAKEALLSQAMHLVDRGLLEVNEDNVNNWMKDLKDIQSDPPNPNFKRYPDAKLCRQLHERCLDFIGDDPDKIGSMGAQLLGVDAGQVVVNGLEVIYDKDYGESISISLVDLCLSQEGKRLVKLPLAVRNFINTTPEISKNITQSIISDKFAYMSDYKTEEGRSIRVFQPKGHENIRFILSGSDIVVQKTFDGERWLSLVDSGELAKQAKDEGLSPVFLNLIKDRAIWKSGGKSPQLLIEDQDKQEILYRCDLKEKSEGSFKIKQIKSEVAKSSLSSLEGLGNKQATVLTEIGSEETMQVWAKNGKVKEVVYNHIQTSQGPLTYEVHGNDLYGKGPLEGFKLITDKKSFYKESGLAPKIPRTVSEYHLLVKETPRGPQVKILFPKYSRINKQPKKKSLNKDIEMRPNQMVVDYHKSKFSDRSYAHIDAGLTSPDDYIIAQINGQGGIVGLEQPEDIAYMAYVHITTKSYGQAKEFWDDLKAKQDISNDSLKQVLGMIDQWPDQSAEALAFKIEAKMLIIQQAMDSKEDISTDDLEDDIFRLVELKQLYDDAISEGKSLGYQLSDSSLRDYERFKNMSNKWSDGINLEPWMVSMPKMAGPFPLDMGSEESAQLLWMETRSRASRLKNPALIDHNNQLTKGAQSNFHALHSAHLACYKIIKEASVEVGIPDSQNGSINSLKEKLKSVIGQTKMVDGDEYYVFPQDVINEINRAISAFEDSEKTVKDLHNLMNAASVLPGEDFGELMDIANQIERESLLETIEGDQREAAGSMSIYELYSSSPDISGDSKAALNEKLSIVHDLNDQTARLYPTKATARLMQTKLAQYDKAVNSNPMRLIHPQYNFPEKWDKQNSFTHFCQLGRMLSLAGDEPPAPVKSLAAFFETLPLVDLELAISGVKLSEEVPRQKRLVIEKEADEAIKELNVSREKLDRLESIIEEIIIKKPDETEPQEVHMNPENSQRVLDDSICVPKVKAEVGQAEIDSYIASAKGFSDAPDTVRNNYQDAKLENADVKMVDLSTVSTIVDYYGDIVNFSEQQPDVFEYPLTSKGLKKLQKDVKNQIAERNQEGVVSNLQKDILSLIEPDLSKAQKAVQQEFTTVPDRLIGLYVSGALDKFEGEALAKELKKVLGYPIALKDGLEDLDGLIGQYIEETVLDKHLAFISSEIDEFSKEDVNNPERMKALDDLLEIKRHFNKDDDAGLYRNLLAIEYVNGFILRKSQVDTIVDMLKVPNSVQQLGMGQGKSSVLLPFLLNNYADGTHLALGMVPEELFPIVTEDLLKSCKEIFGQDLVTFTFDRSSDMSVIDATELLHTFKSAINKENPILTTRTSLLSFRDKYIELITEHNQMSKELLTSDIDALVDQDSLEKLQDIELQLALFSEIFTLFKENGKVICDEIDTILDVTQEYNYPISISKQVDGPLRKDSIGLFKRLGAWADATGPDAEKKKYFFEKVSKNLQATLPEEEVLELTKLMAQEYFIEMQEELKGAGISEDAFLVYMTESNPADLYSDGINLITAYLHDNKDNADVVELINIHNLLSDVFPNLMSKTNNEHFGRDLKQEYTVPYFAAGTPSNSEYASVLQRLAYIGLDYLQKGVSEKQCKMFIQTKYSEYMKLFQDLPADVRDREGAYEPIEAFEKEFLGEYGVSIQDAYKDPEKMLECMKVINQSIDAKLDFLGDYVLPKMTIDSTQVSSNVFDLVSMFSEFNGFSGTTATVNTFHRKLNTENAKSEGTDGKSGEYLTREYNQGTITIGVISDETPSGKSTLEHIKQGLSDEEFFKTYDAVIDAGGFFKDDRIEDIAQEACDKIGESGKKAVVFVDRSNTKLVEKTDSATTEKLSDNKDLVPSDCFTIYDQSHIVGTDIKQKKGARALVLVGSTSVTDLQQAIWRMRGLRDKGQKLDILVKESIAGNILGVREDLINTLRALKDQSEEWNALYEKFSSLPDGQVTMDDLIVYVNHVQDQQVKSLNLQKEIAEAKEMVVDAKLEGFRRHYKENKMTVTDRRKQLEGLEDEDLQQHLEDQSLSYRSHQLIIEYFESDLIQIMDYVAQDTIDKLEYVDTKENLENIMNSYREQVGELSNFDNLLSEVNKLSVEAYYKIPESLLDLLSVSQRALPNHVGEIEAVRNAFTSTGEKIEDGLNHLKSLLDSEEIDKTTDSYSQLNTFYQLHVSLLSGDFEAVKEAYKDLKLEFRDDSKVYDGLQKLHDELSTPCENFSKAIQERFDKEMDQYKPLDASLLPEFMPKSGLSNMDKVTEQEVDVDVEMNQITQSISITEQESTADQQRAIDSNLPRVERSTWIKGLSSINTNNVIGSGLSPSGVTRSLYTYNTFVGSLQISSNICGSSDTNINEGYLHPNRQKAKYMFTMQTPLSGHGVLIDTYDYEELKSAILLRNGVKQAKIAEYNEIINKGSDFSVVCKSSMDVKNLKEEIDAYIDKNKMDEALNQFNSLIGKFTTQVDGDYKMHMHNVYGDSKEIFEGEKQEWLDRAEELMNNFQSAKNKGKTGQCKEYGEQILVLWGQYEFQQQKHSKITEILKSMNKFGSIAVYDISVPDQVLQVGKERDPFMNELAFNKEFRSEVEKHEPQYADLSKIRESDIGLAVEAKCFNGQGSLPTRSYHNAPSEWQIFLEKAYKSTPRHIKRFADDFLNTHWDGKVKGNVYQFFNEVVNLEPFNVDEMDALIFKHEKQYFLETLSNLKEPGKIREFAKDYAGTHIHNKWQDPSDILVYYQDMAASLYDMGDEAVNEFVKNALEEIKK